MTTATTARNPEITIRAFNLYGEHEWSATTRSWKKAWREIWGAGIERTCPSLAVRKYRSTAVVEHGGSKCNCGGAAG